MRIACKDAGDISCVIANLVAELEQPCRACREDAVVLTGRTPTGDPVTVRLLPERVLEVEGGEALLEEIRRRRCHRGM